MEANTLIGASGVAAIEALRDGEFDPETLEAALSLRGEEQEALFELAREARDRCFPGKQAQTRSVIEISNICWQGCRYCNMGRKHSRERYTIELPVFRNLAEYLYRQGRRVLLVQSGENAAPSFVDHVSRCVEALKSRFADMAVILCLGNLSLDQYRQLRASGADRYILKFEASNPALYGYVKPYDTLDRRLECLDHLFSVGFAVGSGNIAGLPGQTLSDIVSDLLLMKRLPLAMSSCTVFIPGEDSDFSNEPMGDADLALNTMALIRIMNPDRLIPTTSSLEKARPGGQYLGLMAGANTVTIHDGTPEALKSLFPIYSLARMAPNRSDIERLVHKAGLRLSEQVRHE